MNFAVLVMKRVEVLEMILTKNDLKDYIKQDALANKRSTIKKRWFRSGENIWGFIVTMRKLEYYTNINKKILFPIKMYWFFRFRSMSTKLGYTIPINTCDKGLSLAHYGTIVINSNARIGKNCRIHEGVTIGATNGNSEAPIIHDNVFIGSGAKILGGISIANDVCIGANAVVVKNVDEEGITVGGVPAKKISNNNSHNNLSPMLNLK